MSAGSFGSALGVTAEIRLRRDSVRADAQAAKQEVQAEFQGMQIDIGAKLVDSARMAAPQITQIYADAAAAGIAQGLPGAGRFPGGASGAAGSGGSSSPGAVQPYGLTWMADLYERQKNALVSAAARRDLAGNLGGVQQDVISETEAMGVPLGMTQGEEIRERATWHARRMAEEEARIAQSRAGINQFGGVGPFSYGPANQEEEDESPTAAMGGRFIGPAFLALEGLRVARGVSEHYSKEADISRSAFEASNMPGRTNSQLVRRGEAEVGAAQKEIDENSGIIGWLRGIASGSPEKFFAGENRNLSNAQIDLSNAQQNQDQETRRRLDLENQITAARLAGNEVLAKQLEITQQVTERQKQMNEVVAGSGDAWAATGGAALIAGTDLGSIGARRDQYMQQFYAPQEAYEQAAGHPEAAGQYRYGVERDKRITDALTQFGKTFGADSIQGKTQDEALKRANDLATKIANDPRANATEKQAAQDFLNNTDSQYDSAENESINRSNQDLQERTKELEAGPRGGAELRIQYQYQNAIQDADAAAAVAKKEGRTDDATALSQRASSLRQQQGAELAHIGGPQFSSGMETWRRMQSAGYGSQGGDDRGASRYYGPGGGGSQAGGMITSRSPGVVSHIGDMPWGSDQTHPLGGAGFAGWHPDPFHEDKQHQLTGGLAGLANHNDWHHDSSKYYGPTQGPHDYQFHPPRLNVPSDPYGPTPAGQPGQWQSPEMYRGGFGAVGPKSDDKELSSAIGLLNSQLKSGPKIAIMRTT